MKHVFVVDDQKSIRDILCNYIENEGFKVTVFMNGESVLAEMTEAAEARSFWVLKSPILPDRTLYSAEHN